MRVPRSLRLGSLLVLLAGLLIVPAAQATEFAQAEHDVAVEDFFFAPDELFVNAGDTVTWTWVGEAAHNVTPVEEGAFPASETQVEGTHQATFEQEGQVPYFCTLHAAPDGSEGMVGVVNVLAQGEPLPEPGPEPRPAPEPGQLPPAEDAVGIALAWSSLFADDGAQTVLLGRDDVFADSLASGGLQGLLDAPLLLTPSDSLDPRVSDELARLGTQRVIILGGVNAISQDVEDALVAAGYTVERAAGDSRIETAIDIAATYVPEAGSAFLVRADAAPGATDPTQAFADSLAVGGAAAREAIPVLLTQSDRLTASVRTFLEQSSITRVYVVGGTAALSDQVVSDLEALDIEVIRIDGANRFETARNVVFTVFGGPPDVAILVDGQAPDAWVSGFTAASAAESAPILLANGDDLPPTTIELLLDGVPVLCGPATSALACERAGIVGTAAPFGSPGTLLAQMQGDREVPGPGAEEALGDFALLPTSADDAICYEIATYALAEPVTGAHIHAGAEGVAGDVVIPLTAPGEATFTRSCTFDLDPAVVADVLANPADYYVNYHTESLPAGAIRGQLFSPEVIGIAELGAEAEVPPSDARGGGFLFLVTDAADHSRVCYFLGVGIDGEEPTAAHIHEGGPEENGDVVIPLELPPTSADEAGNEGTLCLEGLDTALVEDLLANPGDYYVNVHTEAHPDGALRGQLFNPFGGPPPGGGDGPPPGGGGQGAFAATRR